MIRAARSAYVAPWDLAGIPETAGEPCWMDWILTAEWADAEAAKTKAKHRDNATKHHPSKRGRGRKR